MAGAAAILATLLGGAAAGPASAATAPLPAALDPEAGPCERPDGSYVSGCRLVPGWPDGWFRPALPALERALDASTVPANVG
jgi:hypothetical protein